MELSYQESMAIQEKIVSYRDSLREIISIVDDKDCRKLNPIFFLSGEVAAYKILNIWYKQMIENKFDITNNVLLVLGEMETLLEVREKDFSDEAVESTYEEFNQILWYDLFDYHFDTSISEINYDIIGIYHMLQIANDVPIDELEDDDWKINDDAEMGIIYTETHRMFMDLEPKLQDVILEVIRLTKIYKLHFDLLQ